jgi:hypothetical protein
MDCSWCERQATYFLVSDRDSRRNVDHACDEHTEQWRHLYRRAVPVPASGPAPQVVDVREGEAVDLRDAGPTAAALPEPRSAAADQPSQDAAPA